MTLVDAIRMWPTPYGFMGQDKDGGYGTGGEFEKFVKNWPTPQTADGERGSQTLMRGDGNPTMRGAVLLWATPASGLPNDGEEPETWRARQQILKEKGINGNGAGVPLAIQAQEKAALWATPRSSDGEKGGPHQQFGAGGTPLPAQAVSLWATPDASIGKFRLQGDTQQSLRNIEVQARRFAGPDSPQAPTTETAGGPSSNATPTSRLQLNERFVELLMGLPCGWTCVCVPALIGSED